MDGGNFNPAWLYLIGTLAAVLVLWVVVRWLRGRGRVVQPPDRDLNVDVSQLDDRGPPADGPRLEFYGTATRLAVLVIAPAGRTGDLPPSQLLPGLLENLLPGLTHVVASHQPLICRWPSQLSSQGFAQSFFNHLALPGNRGKGTPWCSIAGRLQLGDRAFLVGLVCTSGSPNGLGQVVVRHEGQWLDILRIRES